MKKLCYAFHGLIMIGLLGCGPRNVFEPPPPPEVEVAPPVIEDVTVYAAFPGRLEAVESVAVRARVHGILEQVAFEDGDLVEAGQVLFVIEKEPYEADLMQAEARLAQARAALKLAEAALSRKQKAFEVQAVSELDVLSAEANVASARADIQAAKAARNKAELNLSYATITAPIAGQVDRHRVSIGNLVGGAQPELLTSIVSVDPIDCYFSVDERAAILLRRALLEEDGDVRDDSPKVLLELADGSSAAKPGRIDFIETQIDPATGTLMVRARFPNPDAVLVPGMFGRVRIPHEQPGAMLIPERALQRDMTGAFVLVVQEEVAQSRHLELGPLTKGRRIVTSGLEPDDAVIVRGLQRVRPGSPVRSRPMQATDAGAK